MGIIYQKDKRSGITYAYESKAYWDKEKHQSRAHRTLIGRVSEGGEIIPTDGRCRKSATGVPRTRKRGHVPITQVKRTYCGALDEIGEKTGIVSDLRQCFPDDYRQILSIAYFLILGNNRALMNFPYWAAEHNHPYGEDISSQDSSRLFASISEDKCRHFSKPRPNGGLNMNSGLMIPPVSPAIPRP